MKAIWMYARVAPGEQGKGYGAAIALRMINYLVSLGVTNISGEEGNPAGGAYMQSLGFIKEPNSSTWTKWGLTQVEVNIPDELFETDIRIVIDDFDPSQMNHLISWYRKSDGAAVAKVRFKVE